MADIMFSDDENQKIITKDSFLIYKDRLDVGEILEALEEDDITLSDLGQIFLAMICDQTGRDVPKIDNRYARSIFKGIKRGYDQANKKWLAQCERNRANGAMGGRPKNPDKPSGYNGNPDKPSGFLNKPSGLQDKPNGFLNNPEKPTETQTNPDEPDKRSQEKRRQEKASQEMDKGRFVPIPPLDELRTFMETHDIVYPIPETMHRILANMKGFPEGIRNWQEYTLEIGKARRLARMQES